MHWNDLITLRQSCRSYDTARRVSDQVLYDICRQALSAPSACNSQPWKIRLVSSPQKKAEIQDAFSAAFVKDAQALAVLTETKAELMPGVLKRLENSQYFAQIDLGILAAHLALAATDHGVGSCIIGMFDERKLRETLAISEDETPRLVVALGYPKAEDPLRVKSRKTMEDVLTIL